MARLKERAVEAALKKYSGNMAAVGRAFDVDRSTVHTFVHKRPRLMKTMNDCQESFKDNAESALQKAIIEGEPWAVCFFLKCKAKERGYVERSEVTGKDGDPIKHEIKPVLDLSQATLEEIKQLRDLRNRIAGRLQGIPLPSANGHGIESSANGTQLE